MNSLSGCTYTELTNELKNPKERLVNIRNNVNKCFR